MEPRDMMKRQMFPIAKIYVPTKRRTTLKPEVVQDIANSMLEVGQQTPDLVGIGTQEVERALQHLEERRGVHTRARSRPVFST